MRDPRVDEFIAAAEPFARPILTHVRERVHAVVPDATEALKWNMPAYLQGDAILLITGAFKAHVAINFWRGKDIAPHTSVGAMGQFGRLTSLEDLPADFDALIAEAARLAGTPSKRSAKPAPPPAEIHPEFAAALDAAPLARDHFDRFTAGQRREYVDWIAEAKRGETRARRIASAVEWLSEGKRRNWKHERS